LLSFHRLSVAAFLLSTVFSNSIDVCVMQKTMFLTDAEQRLKSLRRLLPSSKGFFVLNQLSVLGKVRSGFGRIY
jgi:hypothetical protein